MAPPPRRVEVNVANGTLERRLLGSDTDWSTVCRAPCIAPAEPRYEYRIGGDWRRKSDPFLVGNDGSTTYVRGATGSHAGTGLGVGLLSVGALVGLAGLMQLALNGSRTIDDEDARPLSHSAQAGYLGLSVGGFAAGATGLYLILTNRTRIEVTGSPDAAPSLRLRLTPSVALTPQGLLF